MTLKITLTIGTRNGPKLCKTRTVPSLLTREEALENVSDLFIDIVAAISAEPVSRRPRIPQAPYQQRHHVELPRRQQTTPNQQPTRPVPPKHSQVPNSTRPTDNTTRTPQAPNQQLKSSIQSGLPNTPIRRSPDSNSTSRPPQAPNQPIRKSIYPTIPGSTKP